MIAPARDDEHELMTPGEVIELLRLDATPGDPREKLRTLRRRQALPFLRRGRLFLFDRAAVRAWLEAGSGKSAK